MRTYSTAGRLAELSDDAELIKATAAELDELIEPIWASAAGGKKLAGKELRILRLRVEQLRRILDHADQHLRHLDGRAL